MFDSENIKWFNQTVLTFKDKWYSTDGYLRVSINTNTENYRYFNPPMFSFSISNGLQKSCSLTIQNAEDLLESFEQAIKQLNGNDSVIEKSYSSHTKVYFKFAVEKTNQERVVVISLISSETDSTKIIVPLKPTFQSFLKRLRYFVNSYDDICYKLLLETTRSESKDIISQLPSLIKGVATQIITSEDTIQDSRAPAMDDESVSERVNTIEDLDKFLGDNMSNISVPEIDEGKAEEKKPEVEIKSPFVDDILKGDLQNLESKLTSYSVSEIPIFSLEESLSQELGFSLLPVLDEDNKKSVAYLSTLFYQKFSKDYTVNNNSLPTGTPVLRVETKGNQSQIETAYDLLTIFGYTRTLRRRLEGRLDNAFNNKSIFYLMLRTFMDPLCFSYLNDFSKDEILSVVLNRYRSFKNKGFFDFYDRLITSSNCVEVDESDIRGFTEEIADKVIGKSRNLEQLHDTLYESGMAKIPSKNSFTLEQIINEIIPLEVAEKTGIDLADDIVRQKFIEDNNISEEIIKFFTGHKKVKKQSKPIERITPLQRWVEKFKSDIPERYRDEVILHVKELQDQKFDFQNTQWPMQEFDEGIVKALYIWDPQNDPKMKTNSTYFNTLVDNEIMSKEDILIDAKEKSKVKSNTSSTIDFSNLV